MIDHLLVPLTRPTEEGVEHLRDAAAALVERSTLRGAAREIGMSPTGLKKFIQGTDPYGPTKRRLRKWYLVHASPAAEVERDDATAALSVLTFDLAPKPRREAADRMLDCLAQGYDATGRQRPEWVAELRELLKAS